MVYDHFPSTLQHGLGKETVTWGKFRNKICETVRCFAREYIVSVYLSCREFTMHRADWDYSISHFTVRTEDRFKKYIFIRWKQVTMCQADTNIMQVIDIGKPCILCCIQKPQQIGSRACNGVHFMSQNTDKLLNGFSFFLCYNLLFCESLCLVWCLELGREKRIWCSDLIAL